MTKVFLLVTQIIISLILIALILIQSRGAGLGSAFGGKMGSFSTKRGVENLVFRLTIFFAVLFFITSLAQFLVG